jgi:hypothetical protein
MRSIRLVLVIAFSFTVVPLTTAVGTLGIYADPIGDSKCMNGLVIDLYVVYTGPPLHPGDRVFNAVPVLR